MAKKKSKRGARRSGATNQKAVSTVARHVETRLQATRTAMAEPEPAIVPADGESTAPLPGFSIVGIGASAGGLEALSQLLTELPNTREFAIVIVQHLAPEHESVLPEL